VLLRLGMKRRVSKTDIPPYHKSPPRPAFKEKVMNGTTIRMPAEFEPYRNQNQMIIYMLKAMNREGGKRQNAIIESPTGSGWSPGHLVWISPDPINLGKTMGLLMPACAWLAEYKQRRKETIRDCPVHGQAQVPLKTEGEESFH